MDRTSLLIATYTTDFDTAFKNIRVNIKTGRATIEPVQALYTTPINSSCGNIRGLFTPRALIVHFTDGETVRYPMPSIAAASTAAAAFKQITDVECIHLDGEHWNRMPKTSLTGGGVGNFVPNTTGYSLTTTAGMTSVFSGVYDYTSDMVGAIKQKYRVEEEPVEISTKVMDTNCMNNPVASALCLDTIPDLKGRHLILVAGKLGAGATLPFTGSIVRKAPISLSGTTIATCASSYTNIVSCVGYKGESLRNVQNYIA